MRRFIAGVAVLALVIGCGAAGEDHATTSTTVPSRGRPPIVPACSVTMTTIPMSVELALCRSLDNGEIEHGTVTFYIIENGDTVSTVVSDVMSDSIGCTCTKFSTELYDYMWMRLHLEGVPDPAGCVLQ